MSVLTRQIIKDIVAEEVQLSTSTLQDDLKSLEKKFDQKFDGLEQKVDSVITQLTDIAGQFKKFEVATFGVAAA